MCLHPRLVAIGLVLLAGSARADEEGKPVVVMETSRGTIAVDLDRAKAPITVENFLKYVDDGFYDNTLFHRVVLKDPRGNPFVIQGGGIGADLKEKPTRGAIKNESGNGLSNLRGTIAMARDEPPDSATAQFYINLGDNTRLDKARGGYAVFGKVIEGMDVVDAISKAPVAVGTLELRDPDGKLKKQAEPDVPVEPILIKSIRRKGS